jgi:ABC-type multidrug transport system fused ATPase/permease subunit
MNSFLIIINLLDKSEKKKFFYLICLIFIMAFLDMLGVASILPFIAVLSNPQVIDTNFYINYVYILTGNLGFVDKKNFLFFLGFLVFLLLVVSLVVRAVTAYAQVRFTLMQEYILSKNLIENYLNQPYTWFLNKHSADLGKNILSEVKEVIDNTLVPIINIIVYGAMSFALLILLIIVNLKLTIIIGLVLAICYGTIFYSMKKILSRIGSERLRANTERFTTVSETFGAIKEIKSKGLEQIYYYQFEKYAKIFAVNQSIASVISQIPRYFIEAVVFGGMIILVLILMFQNKNLETIIPTIALFSFAGYRLMPGLQNIYGACTKLRFSNKSLYSINNDLKNLKFKSKNFKRKNNLEFKKYIKLKNVNFSYPNCNRQTLKNINITIPIFSKIGIIGPTGSGKTTLIDIILGILDPSSGTLSVDSKIIYKNNKYLWQKIIGYVPQQIYLFDSSISQNISFGENPENINHKRVEEVAKIANIHNFIIKELPDKYNTRIGERGVRLSGGQRQRIGIARALYHKPSVLILDEATSALDDNTEQVVMEAMDNLEGKITIIVIAHRVETLKNCENIFLLEKGAIKKAGKYKDFIK